MERKADGAVIVCGASALQGIRRARRVGDLWSWTPLDAREQDRVLATALAGRDAVDFDLLSLHGFWGGCELEKLELLVGSSAARRRAARTRCRCCSGALPAGSICYVAPGLYATSPAYTAMRYSLDHDLAATTMLLFELMGTYGLHEDATMSIAWGGYWPQERRPGEAGAEVAEQAHYRCDPALAPTELRRMAAAASSSSLRAFERAARIALPGSASPMESVMAAMMAAPHRVGGFALSSLPGGVLLNHRIEFERDAVLMSSGMPYAIADLYVPAALTELEYNGIGHEAEVARAHDGQRNNGMRAMGLKVVVVNRDQMRDIAALEVIARAIFRDAGVRYRDTAPGRRVRQAAWLNGLRAGTGLRPA